MTVLEWSKARHGDYVAAVAWVFAHPLVGWLAGP